VTTSNREPIVWEIDIRTFSGQFLGQWTLAMLVTALVVSLLLGVIFAGQGNWAALPPLLGMIAAVCAGVWLLGLLIIALLFRGRSRVRYTLSERSVRCESVDPAVRKVNRLAIVAGALSGNPGALGAGLLGVSREAEEALWRGAFRAVYHPGRRTIDLRSPWRTLFSIHCTEETYEEVAAAVADRMRQAGTADRVRRASPLRAHLGRTLLVLAASVCRFPLVDELDAGLLLSILVLCFACATVWLMNLFGWVVLAGLAVDVGVVLADLGRASGGESSLFLLGTAVLAWLAIGALRGRWHAALMEGYRDLGS
jgi:hypothetical protein